MKLWLVIICIFWSTLSFCDNISEQKEAKEASQKAILQIPEVRQARKALEKEVTKRIPMDSEVLRVMGTITVTAVQGKIDTTHIKRMNTDIPFGGHLRPDAAYNFRDKDAKGMATLNWDF